MDNLEKYEAVNKTKTLKGLAAVIRSFAINGEIQGRSRSFNAEKEAKNCEQYSFENHNILTREFGIRQQAMMLAYYKSIGI